MKSYRLDIHEIVYRKLLRLLEEYQTLTFNQIIDMLIEEHKKNKGMKTTVNN